MKRVQIEAYERLLRIHNLSIYQVETPGNGGNPHLIIVKKTHPPHKPYVPLWLSSLSNQRREGKFVDFQHLTERRRDERPTKDQHICRVYNYSSFECIFHVFLTSRREECVMESMLEKFETNNFSLHTLPLIHTFSSFVYCLLFLSFLGCPRKKPSRSRAREQNIAN